MGKYIIMAYLDKYPNCSGCPVSEYCGTAVSSIRLCNSYEENESKKQSNNSNNNKTT